MKRPLAVFCIVFLIFIFVMQAAESQPQDFPLFQTEQMLARTVGDGSSVTAAGIVTECSTLSSGVRLFMKHLTINTDNNSEISLRPEQKITFTTEQTEIQPGDYVQVAGFCTLFESASNPGQFDSRAYYFAKNTVCSLKKAEIRQIRHGKIGLANILYQIRNAFSSSFDCILDEKSSGTIAAICLGEKNGMDPEWKSLFQEGGISHILAISGLHITLIGMSLYQMLRRVGLPFAAGAVIAGTVVFLYALMTGFGISALRASIMFLIWLGAQVTGRKYDMVTAAGLAAVLILVRDADSLGDASFLLSFAAVLTLSVLVPCGQNACEIRSSAGKSFFSCAAVWLGTLPVSLYFFYQTSPWSILVNLAVVPLMSVIMSFGIAAAAIGLADVSAGMFLAAPVHYLLNLFGNLCRLEQEFPLPVWVAGRPDPGRMLVYYGILAVVTGISVYYARNRRKGCEDRVSGRLQRIVSGVRAGHIRMLWVLCAVICMLLMRPRQSGSLVVTCLDVGQGDSALVQLPTGEACLIDGGSTSENSVWKYRIEQAVKYYGIGTLDYVFLSHADNDHISGIKEYLEDYEPGFGKKNVHGITLGHLILPPTADEGDFDELKALAAEKGVQVLAMQRGSMISNAENPGAAAGIAVNGNGAVHTDSLLSMYYGEEEDVEGEDGSRRWSITCLAPDSEELSGDRNEDSMVLMLQYGSFRMLFTGDLEGQAELALSESGTNLQADILKVGHHGSGGGSSAVFLQAVSPKFAVISCGADNQYGHPSPETVTRLQEAGSQILQTPEHGAVTIVSDGETFSVETYLSQKNT